LPDHAHGENVDVYIGNGVCESVDKESGFGGGARGAIRVPIGGDWVALLFHSLSAFHNLIFVVEIRRIVGNRRKRTNITTHENTIAQIVMNPILQ
jgi:hypothetical protein